MPALLDMLIPLHDRLLSPCRNSPPSTSFAPCLDVPATHQAILHVHLQQDEIMGAGAGGAAGMGPGAEEEGAFADVVAELMQARISAAEGVRAFAAICTERALLLR